MRHQELSGKAKELPHGAYTKIARRVRPVVSPQHVRAVALGLRKSPRIEAAIERFRKELTEDAA